MKLETFDDLRKEYSEEKYFYVSSEEDVFPELFGSFLEGNFEIWIGSPSTKGAKQPLIYKDRNKYHNYQVKEIIKRMEEIMNHNDFVNDLHWKERGETNKKLRKAINILQEV